MSTESHLDSLPSIDNNLENNFTENLMMGLKLEGMQEKGGCFVMVYFVSTEGTFLWH